MPGFPSATTAETAPTVPFDETVKTHPLLVVDYQKVAVGDKEEIDQLFKACSTIGFFYLKNHEMDAEPMFQMGADIFSLPLEEKMKYEQGDTGISAGYKAKGFTAVDEHGTLDAMEFFNIAKDDALKFPEVIHRTYPAPVEAALQQGGAANVFISSGNAVLRTLLSALDAKLELPAGTILSMHNGHSQSESRTTRAPPRLELDPVTAAKQASLGAHSDFGSFSLLFNRGIGGLQVLVPGSKTENDWQYIRPVADLAVCNIGDALSIFSGGILKSNIHRVVSPPGEQGKYTRWSQVFFIRPDLTQELLPLSQQSAMIAKAADAWSFKVEPGVTAEMWFKRRAANQRIANRKGPETFRASKGTEHAPTVY